MSGSPRRRARVHFEAIVTSREPGDESNRGEQGRDEASRLDSWIRPYIEDSTLWPVTLVFVVVVVVFVAAVALLAWRERNPLAAAALLGLVWMSVDAVSADVRRRRMGLAAGIVVGLWVAVAVVSGVAVAVGAF